MIPRVFHRIWLDEPVPDRWERFWDRFAELHPDWQLRTWGSTEEALELIANRDTFLASDNVAWRSDVLRYEVVARFGGIYVDADVEPLRSFEPLRRNLPEFAFAGWEDRRLLCPTVIGGPAGHPALQDLIRSLPAWAWARRHRPPNQATGPHFLTRRWRRREDVVLYAPVRFYPVGWWERHRLGGPYPEASYAVHHWNQGWDLKAKARVDARAFG